MDQHRRISWGVLSRWPRILERRFVVVIHPNWGGPALVFKFVASISAAFPFVNVIGATRGEAILSGGANL